MIFNQDFKDIVVFTYRTINRTIRDIKNRNITNTYEPLLDFIKEFEVQIKDNRLYMYCEDEYEIRICDVVFYDIKTKSFQIKNDSLYHELLSIVRIFKKLEKEIQDLHEVSKKSPKRVNRLVEIDYILEGLEASQTIQKLRKENAD